MVDTADIGEAAARELLRRERAAGPLRRETYAPVGPDNPTATDLAAISSAVLARPIRYAGDDLDALEQRLKPFGPSWLACDLRLMMRRFQTDGATASPADLTRLTGLPGRPPRAYHDLAQAAAAQRPKA